MAEEHHFCETFKKANPLKAISLRVDVNQLEGQDSQAYIDWIEYFNNIFDDEGVANYTLYHEQMRDYDEFNNPTASDQIIDFPYLNQSQKLDRDVETINLLERIQKQYKLVPI